jgi:hypothetical protein
VDQKEAARLNEQFLGSPRSLRIVETELAVDPVVRDLRDEFDAAATLTHTCKRCGQQSMNLYGTAGALYHTGKCDDKLEKTFRYTAHHWYCYQCLDKLTICFCQDQE